MSIRAHHVTLDEVIDAGITLGLSSRAVAKIARESGYRFDNNNFHAVFKARRAKRDGKAA